MARTIRILGVGDPAVYAYTDEQLDILGTWRRHGGGEVLFDIVPWDRYLSTLGAQWDAPEPAYDIIMLPGHLWLPEFASAGRLAPLTGHYSRLTGSDREDFKPFVRDELVWADEVYLMPSFTDGHLVFFQSDAEGAREIDHSAAESAAPSLLTPSEMAELARRNHGPNRYGIALKADPSEILLDWLPYLWDEGGDLMDESGRPAFAGAAGIAALERYCSLRSVAPEQIDSYGNEEIAAALRGNKVAMATSWGGQAGFIYSSDGSGLSATTFDQPWNVVWSFGVLRQAPDTAAAFELLHYLSSPEVDRMVGRYAGSPVRSSTYRRDATVPWYPAQEAMLDRCRRLQPHPEMNAVLGALTPELAAAFAGTRTAEDSLARADEAAGKALET